MELSPSRSSWEGGGYRCANSGSMQLSGVTGEGSGLEGAYWDSSSWVFESRDSSHVDQSMDCFSYLHSKITWANHLTLLLPLFHSSLVK